MTAKIILKRERPKLKIGAYFLKGLSTTSGEEEKR